jgi:hypothetical protein
MPVQLTTQEAPQRYSSCAVVERNYFRLDHTIDPVDPAGAEFPNLDVETDLGRIKVHEVGTKRGR